MFSAAKIAAPSAGGYTLTKSLRFRSSASAYLNRTPATSSNRQKMTWSFWVKRGIVNNSDILMLFDCTASTSDFLQIGFSSANRFYIFDNVSTLSLSTNPIYVDPSAWYHMMVSVDTTQATASNRAALYVNGVQITSLAIATYPSQNANIQWDTTNPHRICASSYPSYPRYYDGYMAEINFIDGQALTPSSFGSFNSVTGVWQPARYTGTYGTNGFYLPFTNTTSTTTLGYDSSGNGNNWTTNNISLTAGSTYDSMTDVPTLTSATVANYCVMNPNDKTNGTVTDGNLVFNYTSTSQGGACRGTVGMSSGKFYCEVTLTYNGNNPMVGIVGIQENFGITSNITLDTYSSGYSYVLGNGQSISGYKGNNGSRSSYGATTTTGDVVGIAFDATNGTLTYYKNGVSQGTAFTGIPAGTYCFGASTLFSSALTFNFGQQPFTYTPPTGFVALNAYNLPTPTILAGNKYMDATLYTGTGASLSVTNAGAFKPDLVWVKSRSAATDHKLTDSVRGATKGLVSDSTAAETTDTNGLTAFNSNGFTLGTDTTYNNSGATYVGWQWQAGQGSTSSNTNGSITSTVSVNATAGFSVVTYTGNGGASATIGHGLGVAPAMIHVKDRSTTQYWLSYHISTGATQYLNLNTTNAAAAGSGAWNNTAPTSSVFSIGNLANVNNSGDTYVAYCWTPIAGFSAFGSYTGNGSTSGPFIYTGFRPKFILWKCSTSAYDWDIYDTSRDPYNSAYHRLIPDSSGAEQTLSPPTVNILSNGFNLIYGYSSSNNNGDTYIYAAFAENPFKYALAR